MTKLTENFTLEEFTHSQTAARRGIDNVPPPSSHERKNLQRMAEVMEKVRSLLGDKPVLVSSGYRCPPLNKAVGGSKGSAHMHGLAVDFTVPGFGTPLQICKKLQPHMKELEVDQLIHEYNTWCHLAITASGSVARQQALTINTKGTRTGFA